jgi:formylmethanofuran dehydrogenase subunit E
LGNRVTRVQKRNIFSRIKSFIWELIQVRGYKTADKKDLSIICRKCGKPFNKEDQGADIKTRVLTLNNSIVIVI